MGGLEHRSFTCGQRVISLARLNSSPLSIKTDFMTSGSNYFANPKPLSQENRSQSVLRTKKRLIGNVGIYFAATRRRPGRFGVSVATLQNTSNSTTTRTARRRQRLCTIDTSKVRCAERQSASPTLTSSKVCGTVSNLSKMRSWNFQLEISIASRSHLFACQLDAIGD